MDWEPLGSQSVEDQYRITEEMTVQENMDLAERVQVRDG